MKLSRKQVRCKSLAVPVVCFEDQQLTSFAGLFLFQLLFARLALRKRLRACFRSWTLERAYDPAGIVLGLILHLILGFRQLRDSRYYRDDPMVHRVLGVRRLPDVATVSRILAAADGDDVAELRHLCRQLVLERLGALALRRVTLDFDGSVIRTGRWAEGTAVGYNRAKKGQRSYYPLFCTVAQTGQVFDVHHRPGNVHDSNGAEAFIAACVERLQQALPGVQVEVRMDSAFFSDAILSRLDRLGVEFTVSVPFERLTELKRLVEGRRHWRHLDGEHGYFELPWKPKSWPSRHRFIVVRNRVAIRDKAPVQLDLFVPFIYGYECKVVMTNKTVRAREAVRFHNGRGAQEGVFAELKSQGQRVPRMQNRQPAGREAMQCCVEDEGRSLGIGLQSQVPNHLKLLWSRARVVSVEEKARSARQVRAMKTNAGEPPTTCRKRSRRHQNRDGCPTREEPKGSLPIAWVVSGTKVA